MELLKLVLGRQLPGHLVKSWCYTIERDPSPEYSSRFPNNNPTFGSKQARIAASFVIEIKDALERLRFYQQFDVGDPAIYHLEIDGEPALFEGVIANMEYDGNAEIVGMEVTRLIVAGAGIK